VVKLILIVGGIYQGKLDYAKKAYGLTNGDVCDLKSEKDIDISKKVINNLQDYILSALKSGDNPSGKINALDLSDKIIICDDISSGIVPVDDLLRLWREETGRILNSLSTKSERVVRLFCGIETVIK
jgi:adenosyl cobinamide kinase/adenosyl cobinamide phosphate guanylyltransferase